MAVIDIPMVGQSYNLRDWAIDCQRTINLFPQVVESQNAPQVSALLPTPGLTRKFKFDGRIRGLYALTDRMLVVSGTTLYSVDKLGKITNIGSIAGVSPVFFADNSIHVMIVGNAAYSYTIASNTLAVMTNNEGFLGALDVTVLDSRFVWTIPNSGKIQWSNVLNTTTSALNFATAESKSDNLVRTVTNNGQLWLIGEKTTEVWSSTGDANLPFQRVSGAVLPVGCVAKNSVCQFGSSLVWLSRSEHGHGQLVMTQGFLTQRVSNHAIEQEIASYNVISDAISFAYQQNGHSFLVITFPTVQKTWCYDLSTNMWHERSFYNPSLHKHEHHRVMTHCFFNGVHYVGDRDDGRVYMLDHNEYTDDGQKIVRERITPVSNPHGARMIFDEVEIIMQVGQEGNTNPHIIFDWSDDKGRTWSKDRQESIGAAGEYRKRVIFRRLGQSFGRVFRVRITDTARLVVVGAKARVR